MDTSSFRSNIDIDRRTNESNFIDHDKSEIII